GVGCPLEEAAAGVNGGAGGKDRDEAVGKRLARIGVERAGGKADGLAQVGGAVGNRGQCRWPVARTGVGGARSCRAQRIDVIASIRIAAFADIVCLRTKAHIINLNDIGPIERKEANSFAAFAQVKIGMEVVVGVVRRIIFVSPDEQKASSGYNGAGRNMKLKFVGQGIAEIEAADIGRQ